MINKDYNETPCRDGFSFSNRSFDERQKLARGRAYCLAFWCMLLELFVLIIFSAALPWEEDLQKTREILELSFLTIIASGTAVFIFYCILNDARVKIQKSEKFDRYGTYLATVLSIAGVIAAYRGRDSLDYRLSTVGQPLLIALLWCSLSIAWILRMLRLRKEKKDEES